MFRKRVDGTDYDKPFSLKIVDHRYTWRGDIQYVTVHVEQFRYPEQMLAAASILRDQGWPVWTFEPEVWTDDRVASEDTSVDFDADDDTLFDEWGEELPF